MEEYLGQRNVDEQRKEHGYDHHGTESFEHVRPHGKEHERYQSGADLTIPDR